MSYQLSPNEREFQVSICDDETELCLTSSSPLYTRKLQKICSEMGREVHYLNAHTIRVYLPKKCLSLKALKPKRDLSPEEKAVLAERLKKNLAS